MLFIHLSLFFSLKDWSLHSNNTGGYFQCNRYEARSSAQGRGIVFHCVFCSDRNILFFCFMHTVLLGSDDDLGGLTSLHDLDGGSAAAESYRSRYV